MKKQFFVIAIIFIISSTTYALDLSVGFSAGAGISFARGDYGDEYNSELSRLRGNRNSNEDFNLQEFNLAYYNQIDVLLGFLPFLALETGFGFSSSSVSYTTIYSVNGFEQSAGNRSYQRVQIYTPFMLRGIYSYQSGTLTMSSYASAGVKLCVPVDVFGKGEDRGLFYSAYFTMDASFAIGQEFQVHNVHYFGLRLGYDLNICSPYRLQVSSTLEEGQFLIDALTLAVTYRYSFGRVL